MAALPRHASAYQPARHLVSQHAIKRGSSARRVRTGTVGINGYLPDPAGPWGGVRSSGLGRELGPGAIAAYQNLKTLYA